MGRDFERLSCCAIALAFVLQGPTLAEQAAQPAAQSPAETLPSDQVAQAEQDVDQGAQATVVPHCEKDGPAKQPLFRHQSYPDAWRAAQKSNRPILVYVSMPNCPHCVKMAEQTYQLSPVEALVKGSFETITVDRFAHAKLVEKLHVRWYPTTVLVAPNNKVLDVIEGYVDAKQFQQRLQIGLATLRAPTETLSAMTPAPVR